MLELLEITEVKALALPIGKFLYEHDPVVPKGNTFGHEVGPGRRECYGAHDVVEGPVRVLSSASPDVEH